jgi:glutathione S-transferase
MRDTTSRAQLLQGGGQLQVPCLRITDEQGNVTWMYESQVIVNYLQAVYATTPADDRT